MCEVQGARGLLLGHLMCVKPLWAKPVFHQRLGCGVILRFILVELGRDLMKHTLRKVLWFW